MAARKAGVAKKAAAAKTPPAAKTPAAKKHAAKTPAAKKHAAKTPAAKKPAAKTPAVKKPAAKTPAAKKHAAKTPAAKKHAAKTPAAKKLPAARKTPSAKIAPTVEKAPAARKAAAAQVARRADFGAPIDGFFAKQPPALRALLEELRALVEEAAPDATASIKWGMPFYAYGKQMMCALGAHKAHVNLILSGPTGTFDDPDGRLEGEAKIGRHLRLRPGDTVPRAAVRGWVRAAAERARGLAR